MPTEEELLQQTEPVQQSNTLSEKELLGYTEEYIDPSEDLDMYPFVPEWAEKGLVGMGRGFMDVGQAGKQLALSAGEKLGLVDEGSSEEYRQKVADEISLMMPLLEDSRAARWGRVAGQVAPTAIVGGGGGLATRMALGAGGGAVSGGAAAAGQSTEDILTSGAVGLGIGAAVPAGLAGGSRGLQAMQRGGEAMAERFGPKVSPFTRIRANANADLGQLGTAENIMREGTEKARKGWFGDIIGDVSAPFKSAYGINSLEDLTLGKLLSPTGGGLGALGGLATGNPVLGASIGALTGKGIKPTLQALKEVPAAASATGRFAGHYGGRALSGGSQRIQRVLERSPERLGRYAPVLAEALRNNSYASTDHVLQQTDPQYRALLARLDEDEE